MKTFSHVNYLKPAATLTFGHEYP